MIFWLLLLGLSQKPATVSKERAAEIYVTNCQLCHGPNGTGSPLVNGSAFVDRKWKHGTTFAAVTRTITNGVPNTQMLPFKEKLTPQEIAALAALVRSFDKKPKR